MISLDELQEIVNNPEGHLEDIISRKTTNICGTKSYQINASYEFEAMIRNFNGQTLFFTANTADMQ